MVVATAALGLPVMLAEVVLEVGEAAALHQL
jgi:hypothetical protein